MMRISEEFYNKNWSSFNEKFEKRYPLIIKMVGANKKVLDIGCGKGLLSSLIQKQNNNVIGIDTSDEALKKAEIRGIKVKKVNVEDSLPFSNNEFDCVVCSEVIEHLFNPVNLLIEIRRVLKPGGYLILTTPNVAYILRRIALLIGKFPEEVKWARTSNTNEEEHIRFFTLNSLTRILKSAMLNRIDVKGVDRFTSIPLSKVSMNLFAQGFVVKAVNSKL